MYEDSIKLLSDLYVMFPFISKIEIDLGETINISVNNLKVSFKDSTKMLNFLENYQQE